MSPEDTADLMRQLDEVIGPIEGDDPKIRRRVRILDAATGLFQRQGYRKTSMDEVAQEAGVAKGTLYLYFTKKIDLLMAAIGREKKTLLLEVSELFDDRVPARERLRKFLQIALLGGKNMPLTTRLMRRDADMRAVFDEIPPALLAQGDRNRDAFLLPLIDTVVGPGEWPHARLREYADVLVSIGMLAPLVHAEHVRRGLTPERYAEIFADMILEGLCRKDDTP